MYIICIEYGLWLKIDRKHWRKVKKLPFTNFHRMKCNRAVVSQILRMKMLTLFKKKVTFFGDFHALNHVFFKFGVYLMCVSSMGQKFKKRTIFERFEKELSEK